MPEISFPFEKNGGDGGRQAVSQVDWQKMATMWGGDRVAYRITATSPDSATLPFYSRVLPNTRTLEVSAGEAWVGGFYYKLEGTKQFTIGSNFDKAKDRRDVVVIRVDHGRGSANMEIRQSQPSSNPVPPQPIREAGQQWEMVIGEIFVPRDNAAPQLFNRAPFDTPTRVSFPWWAADSTRFLPQGTFALDLDSDARHVQEEIYKGRDGVATARTLGKSWTYEPELVNAASLPKGLLCRGRWRWAGPNLCWFTVDFDNSSSTDIKAKDGALSFTVPHNMNGVLGQAFTGFMLNDGYRASMPNYASITGMTWGGNRGKVVRMTYPSPKYLSDGLDYLTTFPSQSSIVISGMYETNAFNE
ncbi:hypothetical protein M1P56_09845 [Streptomyces sp. HU2014]|uniref:hypothetical protein n=1 Tax=Streptomyces sp. HU2014 TaxID=2939414 RepID=UPI00200F4E9A|nr:hypothetical protein [Streptomyces sp. HU2014]UQI44628.1 hypothetical protein M1P56_09845 [Streptomyces sp. HU2014]